MESIERHPWDWYGPQDSRTLVVGTFPPTRNNWSFDFFYPNKRNFFWRILSEISGKELKYVSGLEAVQERKNILDHLKITVTDMGRTIARRDNNSRDENLHPIAYMDILEILEERPWIRKIIFTSSSGKASAARWFQDYIGLRGIRHRFPRGPKPIRSQLQVNGRIIDLAVVYSPSARAANRISFERLTALYREEIII